MQLTTCLIELYVKLLPDGRMECVVGNAYHRRTQEAAELAIKKLAEVRQRYSTTHGRDNAALTVAGRTQ